MNFLEKIKKNWVILALLAIMAVGIFLRTHNLESWLFFQSDQARDLNVANRAVENGPGWLPLLGPKAGGTYLRLGPIFYYFEYLSALIFGTGSPAIVVIPDLLFSILSIPLLFLFLREFFSKKYSLLLTAGYTLCFFEIQYARFAWNPNSLPFFNLLFFYAVFKLFQADNNRAKTWWAILVGVAYAVASQLHFVSLLSLPVAMVVIFLVRKFFFKNKKENWWKYLGIIILICSIFYIPVILSDLQSHGNNTLNFLKSFGQKGSGSTDILQLVQKDLVVFSKYFLVILTGIIDASKNTIKIFALVLLAFFAAGIFLFKKEIDRERKFFLGLVFVWFFSYFITYFPLGSTLQPRHFLVILPLPFICVGFLLCSLEKLLKFRYVTYVATLALFVPIIANAYSVKVWFSEIIDSQTKISTYRKSALLKSVGGESWWHLEKTAQFMSDDCEKSRLVIVPLKQSYRSLFDYAMKHVSEKRSYSIRWGSVLNESDTCFYAIIFSKNNISAKFDDQIIKLKRVAFGDITVVRFGFSEGSRVEEVKNPFRKNMSSLLVADSIDDEVVVEISDQEAEVSSDSVTDGDSSDSENGDAIDVELDSGNNSSVSDNKTKDTSLGALIQNVGRKNRIFWKDLFEN